MHLPCAVHRFRGLDHSPHGLPGRVPCVQRLHCGQLDRGAKGYHVHPWKHTKTSSFCVMPKRYWRDAASNCGSLLTTDQVLLPGAGRKRKKGWKCCRSIHTWLRALSWLLLCPSDKPRNCALQPCRWRNDVKAPSVSVAFLRFGVTPPLPRSRHVVICVCVVCTRAFDSHLSAFISASWCPKGVMWTI